MAPNRRGKQTDSAGTGTTGRSASEPDATQAASENDAIEIIETPASVELQAIQDRIAQLEQLKQLQAREAELTKELQEGRRHRSYSDSSSDRGEIKIKNLPTFNLNYTLKQRDDWLLDLKQTFEGARKKYKKDERKILKALAEMEPECRARWHRHVTDLGPERAQVAKTTWEVFEEWTKTLLRHMYNEEAEVMKRLNYAVQLPNQPPEDFHAYLDSLEKKFQPEPEEKRALLFYSKLRYEVQRSLELQNPNLPKDRLEMVSLASRHWHAIQSGLKRSHAQTDASSNPIRKNPKRFQGDSPQNQPRKDFKPRGQTPHASGSTPRQQNPATSGNPIGADGKQLTCYTCGSRDHFAPACPKREDKAGVSQVNREKSNRFNRFDSKKGRVSR